MPLSTTRSSDRSPISEVPYDVLREIFLHCLPRRLAQAAQPDTTIAPMLLCQICSSWRMIALAYPSLWSHFSYSIIAQSIDPNLESWVFRQKNFDFMLWWKNNQGSMPPFLRLHINIKLPTEMRGPLHTGDGLAFLTSYMTSAQHLQVNSPFWQHIHDRLAGGDQIVLPHLHTLVNFYDPYFYRAQILIARLSTRNSSALRRLAVKGLILPANTIIPNHWSKLTHLFMHDVAIYTTSWFSLIRALPDLQWASINFIFTYDDEYAMENYTKPAAKYTQHHLSTLLLNGQDGSTYRVPLFALMFSIFHLPALQTLSLSSFATSWNDHRAIPEIYAVLRSTPTVTTFVLRGHEFLSLSKTDYPAIGDVQPIWSHAPHLTHLQLDLPRVDGYSNAEAGEKLDTFVRNIFWPECRWLALSNPTCPIRTVTFISGMASFTRHNIVKDLTTSSILTHLGGASNFIFNIISGEGDDPTGAFAWMEWGTRNY